MPKSGLLYRPNDGSTATVEFHCVAVVNRHRLKRHGSTYTNMHCPKCGEWTIIMSIGNKKKTFCSFCGAKLKINSD